MNTQCTGEPISWLRLERYALGELAQSDRNDVQAHLAQCSACGAAHAHLRARAVPMPPLEVRGRAAGGSWSSARASIKEAWQAFVHAPFGWTWGAVGATVAVLLFVLAPEREGVDVEAPKSATIKGGE